MHFEDTELVPEPLVQVPPPATEPQDSTLPLLDADGSPIGMYFLQPETREQSVFFVQVENDGADLRLTRVNRTLSVSGSPLTDALNALLSGPTAEEAQRGIVSFIPPDARVISVRVEGHAVGDAIWNTAYVNFNEYFRYNTRGIEGFASQIQQVVWTATEFPNVRDVQILIEGNRVDFLHGGVRIGSPIGR